MSRSLDRFLVLCFVYGTAVAAWGCYKQRGTADNDTSGDQGDGGMDGGAGSGNDSGGVGSISGEPILDVEGAQVEPGPGDTAYWSADGYSHEVFGKQAQPQDESTAFDTDIWSDSIDRDAYRDLAWSRIQDPLYGLYRFTENGHLVSHTPVHGLQIFDVNDPASPMRVGRLPMAGQGVEMIVYNDLVYLLMKEGKGYGWTGRDLRLEPLSSGQLICIDITEAAAPIIKQQISLPGMGLHLSMHGAKSNPSLVAASSWEEAITWQTKSAIERYLLTLDGTLEKSDELHLYGWLSYLTGGDDSLIAANGSNSELLLVDVSDSSGLLELKEDKFGWVRYASGIAQYGNRLHMVSSTDGVTELFTIDLSDLNNPIEIDRSFTPEEGNIFFTIMGEKRAVFQQSGSVDVFSIDADGHIKQMPGEATTGYFDVVSSVFDETHLLVVGASSSEEHQLLVTLYDMADPAVSIFESARATVASADGNDEREWNPFSALVIEDKVAVAAEDGTLETGLIFVPFSDYGVDGNRYTGAQLITFSNSTITPRGFVQSNWEMNGAVTHGQGLVLAEHAEPGVLFIDVNAPDIPILLKDIALEPNYSGLIQMSTGVVRAQWNGGSIYHQDVNSKYSNTKLQVLSPLEDPAIAEPLATLTFPEEMQLYPFGNQVVGAYRGELGFEGAFIELSDPAQPVVVGGWGEPMSESTNYGPMVDNDDGDEWYVRELANLLIPVGTSIVSAEYATEEAPSSYAAISRFAPSQTRDCQDVTPSDPAECNFLDGAITCVAFEDGEELCHGGIYSCLDSDVYENSYDCIKVDLPSDALMLESTAETAEVRKWRRLKLRVRDPNAVAVGWSDYIEMPYHEESAGIVVDGNRLYLNYRVPESVIGDRRPFVKYYVKILDLSDPGNPQMGEPINIPGVVIRAAGDNLYTAQPVYGVDQIETAINRVQLIDGKAVLQARTRIRDQFVRSIAIDEHGVALAVHMHPLFYHKEVADQSLSIMTLQNGETHGSFSLDPGASIRVASNGKGIFTAHGGILVIDYSALMVPTLHSYLPFNETALIAPVWIDDQLFFSGEQYGIYKIDETTLNL